MSDTTGDIVLPAKTKNSDSIDELETLVHGLREVDTRDDFFDKITAINKKIDIIKETVERLCVTTSGCIEVIASSISKKTDETKPN